MSLLLNIHTVLMLVGLVSGGLAIALRDAEERLPDPNNIAVRDGLGHMVVGLLGWAGVIATLIAGFYALGVLLPAGAAVVVVLVLHFTHFGERLFPFYRYQTPLALIALVAAFWLWANVFSLIQGVT